MALHNSASDKSGSKDFANKDPADEEASNKHSESGKPEKRHAAGNFWSVVQERLKFVVSLAQFCGHVKSVHSVRHLPFSFIIDNISV